MFSDTVLGQREELYQSIEKWMSKRLRKGGADESLERESIVSWMSRAEVIGSILPADGRSVVLLRPK